MESGTMNPRMRSFSTRSSTLLSTPPYNKKILKISRTSKQKKKIKTTSKYTICEASYMAGRGMQGPPSFPKHLVPFGIYQSKSPVLPTYKFKTWISWNYIKHYNLQQYPASKSIYILNG